MMYWVSLQWERGSVVLHQRIWIRPVHGHIGTVMWTLYTQLCFSLLIISVLQKEQSGSTKKGNLYLADLAGVCMQYELRYMIMKVLRKLVRLEHRVRLLKRCSPYSWHLSLTCIRRRKSISLCQHLEIAFMHWQSEAVHISLTVIPSSHLSSEYDCGVFIQWLIVGITWW